MSEAAFIAGDWGTSRLRLYLCDTRGVVLARGEGEGASVPDCAGRFAAAVAPWDKAHGVLPAVLGGMVGSTIGWKEVPYLRCPARPQAIAGASLRFEAGGRAIAILPGQKHKLWNTGRETLRLLCTCAPAYENDDTVITEVVAGS